MTGKEMPTHRFFVKLKFNRFCILQVRGGVSFVWMRSSCQSLYRVFHLLVGVGELIRKLSYIPLLNGDNFDTVVIYQVMRGCAQLDVTYEAISLSQSNLAQALICLMNLFLSTM